MQTIVEVRINDEIIQCKEICVLEIIEDLKKQENNSSIAKMEYLLSKLTNIDFKRLAKMYGNEQRKILKGIKEANSDFFGIAEDLGVSDFLETILKNLKIDLAKVFMTTVREFFEKTVKISPTSDQQEAA